jgi:polar amino acid transport system substrate-binding protein
MQIKQIIRILLLTFLWHCLSVQAQTFTCVKSVRWIDSPPYGYKDKKGVIRGLHVDLVREALRRMKCDVRLIDMPWSRAIIELEHGRLDILPGAGNTKERREFAIFSKPSNSARNILFLTTESAKEYRHTKLADIIGTKFRLSTARNASRGDEYDALLANPQFTSHLTYVRTPMIGWLMMEKNRIEGQIEDELAGLYKIKEMGLEHLIKPSKLITSNDADYVAFSKKTNDVAFVNSFDAALSAMLADGTYKETLKRYLPCPISMKNLGCE